LFIAWLIEVGLRNKDERLDGHEDLREWKGIEVAEKGGMKDG